jgi:hypothetical protein
MRIIPGKKEMWLVQMLTPTHGIVLELVRKVGVGHKIFMNSYFTSPKLINDLHIKINACGTVHYKRKAMLPNFSSKHLRLKRGKTVSRVREI